MLIKNYIKQILRNKHSAKFAIPLFIKLHNWTLNQLGIWSVINNNGIHPKHHLINYHEFFIKNINTQDCVLDIGCGNGFVAYQVARKAKKVTAIDINSTAIADAQKKFAKANLEFITGNALNWQFSEKFDVIILSNVLEHIEQRIEFLQKIKPLAPKIIIRVPMINRDWLTLYKKQMGHSYLLDNTHFIEYTLESFSSEIRQAGFSLQDYSIQFGEIWGIIK